MIGCIAYYFSNNISAIIFLGIVFFLALIYILFMYITIRYDYKILKEAIKDLDIYMI